MVRAGWHLPQLAPHPWAPGCLCFEPLAGRVWSSHTGLFRSPWLAGKHPAILKSSPGSRSWVAGSLVVTMVAVSVFPPSQWDYCSELGPVQPPTSQVPWDRRR